jgi:hypothetical protein
MGLFDTLFGSDSEDMYDPADRDRTQANADYWAQAGGWRACQPTAAIGRAYDPGRDDTYSHGGQPHN